MRRDMAARDTLKTAQLLFQFITFFASRFQVEHQVFDVQSQLRERFLNEHKDTVSASNRLNDLLKCGIQFGLCWHVQTGNQVAQLFQFQGNASSVLFRFRVQKSNVVVHEFALPAAFNRFFQTARPPTIVALAGTVLNAKLQEKTEIPR